jgi:DNA-binding transcriptional MerR regulator
MTGHPPSSRPDDSEPGYLRIGELARRTGTSPEVLRAWERRYGLLRPSRSRGGFRLYTAADEARIRRMRDYLASGLAAAEAARLAVDAETRAGKTEAAPRAVDDAARAGRVEAAPRAVEVEAQGVAAAAVPTGRTAETAEPSALQAAAAALTAALDRFDEEQANAVLDRLLATYRIETVLRDLLVPYLHDLGERWARGAVSVAQEHFASNLLRGRLLAVARGWGQGRGPAAVLACPPGEQHDLGLLAFGITLHRRGWRIIYLGPDTPITTIRQATADVASLVVLAATVPAPLAAHADALAELASQTPVALGGAGATPAVAARTGARLLDQDPVSAAESLDQAMGGPVGRGSGTRFRRRP